MDVQLACIEVNGVVLHVAEAGPKDGRLVILLHGCPEPKLLSTKGPGPREAHDQTSRMNPTPAASARSGSQLRQQRP